MTTAGRWLVGLLIATVIALAVATYASTTAAERFHAEKRRALDTLAVERAATARLTDLVTEARAQALSCCYAGRYVVYQPVRVLEVTRDETGALHAGTIQPVGGRFVTTACARDGRHATPARRRPVRPAPAPTTASRDQGRDVGSCVHSTAARVPAEWGAA